MKKILLVCLSLALVAPISIIASPVTTQNKKDADDIQVLDASWSTLNNPTRLRTLAQNHIDLKPIKAEQIINYSALPFNYESSESQRDVARKNIAIIAQNNKTLKKMAKSGR